MKKKKNIFLILTLLIIVLLIIIELFIYKQKMIDEKNLIENWINNGNTLIKYKMKSSIFVYIDIIQESYLSFMMFIPPILVMYFGLKKIYNILSSGFVLYIVNTREKYKSFIKREIKKCYNYAFIIPLLYLIIVLGCGLITNFENTLSLDGIDHNAYNISFNSQFVLIFLTFINLFLADSFYISIGLLTMNKKRNFLLNILFSYLIIVIISVILELGLGHMLSLITGKAVFANLFNFYNIWYPSDCGNILFITIYLSALNIISIILVKNLYKKEEKILYND